MQFEKWLAYEVIVS